jgi:hypothetical protein
MSQRVQYCVDKAAECERLALDSQHPDRKFIYSELAEQWRKTAKEIKQLEDAQSAEAESAQFGCGMT